MADKKTGPKPKAPKAQKLATSKKKLASSKSKVEESVPEERAETPVPNSEVPVTAEPPASLAKAGRRSAKAAREAEAKEAKQARKEAEESGVRAEAPKEVHKPPRSRLERAGKKYRTAAELIEKGKLYSLDEAISLATQTGTTKFDSTVEMHINLNVDPTQADQNIRDTLVLPSGSGKKIRIAVFAEADEAKNAQAAGADLVGGDDFLALLDKEEVEFDVLITSPTLMPRLSKYARFLGPKGLMPNPKSGTVTKDTAKAVTEARAGRVEYRVDGAGIVHVPIGKVSFGAQKLGDNARAVAASIRAAKPASLKGIYLRSAYLTTTMGPSVKTSLE